MCLPHNTKHGSQMLLESYAIKDIKVMCSYDPSAVLSNREIQIYWKDSELWPNPGMPLHPGKQDSIITSLRTPTKFNSQLLQAQSLLPSSSKSLGSKVLWHDGSKQEVWKQKRHSSLGFINLNSRPPLGNGLVNMSPWQHMNMQQDMSCWRRCFLWSPPRGSIPGTLFPIHATCPTHLITDPIFQP
jgi:hypothetical protein